jgi:hypothetical protein
MYDIYTYIYFTFNQSINTSFFDMGVTLPGKQRTTKSSSHPNLYYLAL